MPSFRLIVFLTMKRLIVICFVVMSGYWSFAQCPALSLAHWLSLDTSLVIHDWAQEMRQRNWLATVHQNRLYFCHRKSFQAQDKAYRCVIHVVDLNTFRQDTLSVSYPTDASSWKRDAQSCCVYALSLEKDRLLLVCDNYILLYCLKSGRYEFMQRAFCRSVCTGYLYQNEIYAIVDDKEQREFRWLCYGKNMDKDARVIRTLPQPAAFLLQFDPNRYVFVNQQCLYYMPPGACDILKYSLQGVLQDSIHYEVEGWKPFPQEFMQQIHAMPYGTERIYCALNHQYRQYSFAKTIDPLSDSLILLSVNLGDASRQQQLAVMRLRKTKAGWQQDFCTLAVTDTGKVYNAAYFPVSYHLSSDNLLVYPYRNQLLQLLVGAEKEVFMGRSVMQYRRDKEAWFKTHDPVLKLRVQRVKKEWAFQDFDNTRLSLNAFKQDKLILLVNRQPQCSACQKHLLKFLSSVDTAHVAVACFMGRVDSYLPRRQQLQQLDEICTRFYSPLYAVDEEDYGMYTMFDSYPAVIFWQRGFGVVAMYAAENVFTSDYNRYEFSESFLNDFRRFVGC